VSPTTGILCESFLNEIADAISQIFLKSATVFWKFRFGILYRWSGAIINFSKN